MVVDDCPPMRLKYLILGLLLLLSFMPGVMAQNVSFAEPDKTVHQTVNIYYTNNGTLYDSCNTTSTDVLLPASGDIIMIFKPQYEPWFTNPVTALQSGMLYIQTYWIQICVIFGILVLLWKR